MFVPAAWNGWPLIGKRRMAARNRLYVCIPHTSPRHPGTYHYLVHDFAVVSGTVDWLSTFYPSRSWHVRVQCMDGWADVANGSFEQFRWSRADNFLTLASQYCVYHIAHKSWNPSGNWIEYFIMICYHQRAQFMKRLHVLGLWARIFEFRFYIITAFLTYGRPILGIEGCRYRWRAPGYYHFSPLFSPLISLFGNKLNLNCWWFLEANWWKQTDGSTRTSCTQPHAHTAHTSTQRWIGSNEKFPAWNGSQQRGNNCKLSKFIERRSRRVTPTGESGIK